MATEHILMGGNDEPLTPTNVQHKSHTNYGASTLKAYRAGPAILYVDSSQRSVREYVFNFEQDRYVGPDLLQLAEHLVPKGTVIRQIAFMRSPIPSLWAALEGGDHDGVLIALTYLREEQVIGWTRHLIGGNGLVRSVAVIPHSDGDREQVWLVVERMVNGIKRYYIEALDDTSPFDDANGVNYGAMQVDCGARYAGTPATVITGLAHLEGEEVYGLADGMPVGPFTVNGGTITLDDAAADVELGLPFTATLVPITPEVPMGGTTQGVKKRAGGVVLRVVKTGTLKVNGEHVMLRGVMDAMGTPVPLYTGKLPRRAHHMSNFGWSREGKVTITRDQPLPATVTMLSTVLGIGS
jgi:hypothetical protein